MKITTGILGCALVAGLMAFAADKAQAAVIGNTLYSPLKIKLTATYTDSNGKLKKASATNKDILGLLHASKGDQLAVDNNHDDIWIINKNTTVHNLSTNNVMWFDYTTYVSAYSGKDDNKYTSSGLIDVYFYDTGEFSEYNNNFHVSGVYTFNDSYGNTDKNGYYQEMESYKASGLSGDGYFSDLFNDNVPVTGSFSSKGSGKILD